MNSDLLYTTYINCLKKYRLHIKENKYIYLDTFAKNILLIKNYKAYIDKISGKIKFGNKWLLCLDKSLNIVLNLI